jgi:hypothetical protein
MYRTTILGIAHEWNQSMGEWCIDGFSVAVAVGMFCTFIRLLLSTIVLYDYCALIIIAFIGWFRTVLCIWII